jgi:transcriptional antiterminator RfaH
MTMQSIEMERWYVAYSMPRKESFAQLQLERQGIEVFFPQLLLPYPRRRSVVPLFPRYLFVRPHTPAEYYATLWTPGVKELVSFNGTPAPLEDEVVTFLRQRANPEGVLPARSTLKVGAEVQIGEGPLQGLAGILINPPDAKGRVTVLLNLLRREVKVTLLVEALVQKVD